MPYQVRLARPSDIEPIAKHMRVEDKAEVYAAQGIDPLTALAHSYEAGRTWVGVDEEGPQAMFGIRFIMDGWLDYGAPWMLATDRLERHSKQFLRTCKPVIDSLHDYHPILCNAVDARNHVHIKWLVWAGFEFTGIIPQYGFEGRPFYKFQRVKH